MKKVLCLATAFVLTAGLAAAGQGPSGKKPRPLADHDLEAITAGSAAKNTSASGGVLVAGSSNATVDAKGSVSVGDTAQQDSRALNLVNASDSAIANSANVWDGRIATPPTTPATTSAANLTDVTGETSGGRATLNVDQSNNVLQLSAHSASLPSYVRTEANIDETSVTTREIVDAHGKVDTKSEVVGQSIQAGQGFAGAASGDLDIKGGSISVTNNVDVSIEGGSGLDIGGGLFKGNIDAKTTFSTEQTLNWVLPDLSLHVEGVVCAVSMGSCEASGSFKSSSEISRSTRGPVAIRNASAEYIVVDGSTLDVTSDFSVALSGSAMQGARALNMVNAAGSSVANAVNISRSPTTGPVLNLNQVNVVRQTR